MRPNLQIKVGTYTGDGTDSRNITGIGFRPDVVIVKGGANVACIRTREMRGDASVSMASSVALAVDQIQELLNDGFQVGTSALVNTNATAYFYIALKGLDAQRYFRTGRYIGNGADGRDYTVGGLDFTPDFVSIFGNIAQAKVWRSSAMVGDSTAFYSSTTNAANEIQSLIVDGFQLGTAGEVNGNTNEHFFFAMKALKGVFAVGTYVGDGIDDKAITGLGFSPSAVIVKRNGASQGRLMTTDMAVNNSAFMGSSAAAAGGVKSLDANGFTIGTNSSVNTNGDTYFWIAFKDGNHNVPIERLAS